MKERKVKCAEVVSDYRQPRRGDNRNCCIPGEWGYESIVPDDLRDGASWVKSMNSPSWTRENIGEIDIEPGEPYPDPEGFGRWLLSRIGEPDEGKEIILFGLTADRCVLCMVQELRFRGYDPIVLYEATDVRSGSISEKDAFLSHTPFTFWGRVIRFEEVKEMMKSS
ncbi:MAG: hypothetical protein U9R75_05710 [Candidatus Thermoplasmatota archaeon]|nr:hypothetical protein [Candidatus Thermoplasmatota archaeon]